MTSTRLSQPPKGYVRPSALPLLALDAVRALLRRLRCGTCRARLAVDPPLDRPGRLYCLPCGREYAEVVERLPERVSFKDEPPRRGRPPKATPFQQGKADRALSVVARFDPSPTPKRRQEKPCPDCPTGRTAPHRERCRPCHNAYFIARGPQPRLVALLHERGPLGSRELAALLGVSYDALRGVIRRARVAGLPIVQVKRRYQIAEVAS